ncbi:A/G-specific adenine glycosylase [Aureibacter tunicatorum]|uniref:Adenine DNA glycosylase n=1 Tax=Aureibacter tunicatorum TaxID=866807 RepID=A0AAE4BQM4_9BACT|nr:A/G-specific adenine glycosylase [Aureibacter tunicatorum]MDR6237103.1 A/G-specific adenine glycosylase [Aureibacter tunicatorum]BDD06095.1 A/G-specific adenine glycosylase [Aureibacter tunicatorum]
MENSTSNKQHFSNTLINWYHQNKRNLPWRNTTSAYHIWLSEIILQQTRVSQGLPYYQQFTEKFPTIQDLANAQEDEVMRTWQGLGYYSRARNLHKCAKIITENFLGKFPESYKELLKLPGIGPYTGAAIASFAFKEPVPAIDGNAYRVLSRVFGLDHDLSESKTFRKFFEASGQLIPDNNPDDYNQAIMEFGAMHCTPKNPNCQECPFISSCFAYENNQQHLLPVKTKKTKVSKRHMNYLVFRHADTFFMKQRSGKDIWQGLYDFYCLESENNPDINEIEDKLLFSLLNSGAIVEHESTVYKHVLSHRQLFIRFYVIDVQSSANVQMLEQSDLIAFEKETLEEIPKPIIIDKFLKIYNGEQNLLIL